MPFLFKINMITEEQIQSHINEAKKELNTAIQLACKFGEQKSSNGECCWTTDTDNLSDGMYVGMIKSGGLVFVQVVNGKLFPNEYCKNLLKWCKLPE